MMRFNRIGKGSTLQNMRQSISIVCELSANGELLISLNYANPAGRIELVPGRPTEMVGVS